MTARSMTLPRRCVARAAFVGLICLWTAAARAQDTSAATAAAQSPSWIIPDLAAAARAEGALTVYSSMNEQEGLPLWKMFEDAAGVKVNYVRSSDSIILSRIAIESRGRQRSWDLAVTTTVNRLPNEALLQFDPPQARGLIAQARDPNRRWYGVYANYNTPAYNTNLVKPSQLPKSYEEFLDRKEWAGKIALDDTDDEWLSAMIIHYGEERGKKLLKDIAAVLKPVMVDGHLALARSVGAGEYWLALFAGAASQRRPAGRKLHAQPRGRAVPDHARPHADPPRRDGQPRLRQREVEGQKNHCHYLRRGRAEEMAGAVQGHLQAEVAARCNRSGEPCWRRCRRMS